MSKPTPAIYGAIAMQSPCYAVNRCKGADARKRIMENISRLGPQIAATLAFQGADVRLLVYPEYFLTGFPMGESIAEWLDKACLAPDGPEYAALGGLAQKFGIFLAGNGYESDPHFEGLYFQTSFIIDPSGEVILRYRRLNSMYAPTPHDVLDRYLDHYGVEGLFPVVDTELGSLAAIASEEILYPELTRALALRGAEVLIHPTSEVYSPQLTPKNIAKLARATENLLYVVSANSAGILDTAVPQSSTDGGSKIVDYRGLILAESGPGESMTARADIDLAASRRFRARPEMTNTFARQRLEVANLVYGQTSVYPANTLDGVSFPKRSHFKTTLEQTVADLTQRGVI